MGRAIGCRRPPPGHGHIPARAAAPSRRRPRGTGAPPPPLKKSCCVAQPGLLGRTDKAGRKREAESSHRTGAPGCAAAAVPYDGEGEVLARPKRQAWAGPRGQGQSRVGDVSIRPWDPPPPPPDLSHAACADKPATRLLPSSAADGSSRTRLCRAVGRRARATAGPSGGRIALRGSRRGKRGQTSASGLLPGPSSSGVA